MDAHQAQVLGELVELLVHPERRRRQAEHPPQRRAPARNAARHGFTAELLETTGNPLVYGELRVPGATRTLLFYCHYDGQPVDAKEWKQADPFKPVLRTGRVDRAARHRGVAEAGRIADDWRLYARSASDDKSPIVALWRRSMR